MGPFHRGLLDGKLNLVRLRIKLHEQVPLFHADVVVHKDTFHVPRNAGSHDRVVAVDIGIVRGNGIQGRGNPRHEEIRSRCKRDGAPASQSRSRRDGAGLAVRGVAGVGAAVSSLSCRSKREAGCNASGGDVTFVSAAIGGEIWLAVFSPGRVSVGDTASDLRRLVVWLISCMVIISY